MVLRARKICPTYVTYDEDKYLMSDKWKNRYKGQRIAQWDNTEVRMTKPGNAGMQRSTYLNYYSSNCAKRAVQLQLCGWMVTRVCFQGESVTLNIW